ncbi:hypothetical protein [Phytohabitans rumicis]|uniref:DUF1579 domain-containing protein n=1 Tax=Phytohabitans rumicis TaxID=1076125 RepID=A0A6V8KZQ0_9ACTN|nr:hypothetical protein [Phytohabitans rumicis]GFJ88820.1 hypothetical protein Prum_024620 [Phytohabitans rumicis]
MNDFDFFVGTWDVANRYLTKRLAGGDDWEEFPGRSVAQSFFGGAGSFDEIEFPTKGRRGASFRLYDPATELWSIYWASSLTGHLDPPVVGRFVDGVGEFQGDDVWEGQPVRMRFIWSRITPTSARWEQAFSPSSAGEPEWETNWYMDFTRVA